MKLRYALLPAIVVCASVVAMAQNQFDGTWALNQSKSQLGGDIMHFAPAGNGMMKYTDSEETYTFKPDGSPFTTPTGREDTFKKTDDQTYETTTKLNGVLLRSATWKLGDDGKTLSIDSQGTKPNGETFENTTVFDRTGGTKGLAGSWKSKDVKLSSPNTLTFTSEGNDGITLDISAIKATCSAKWDGKDYPASGPTVPDGVTLALSKSGSNGFKMVEKLKGKVISMQHYTLSADGKTMMVKGTNGKGAEPYTEVWEKQA